MSLARRINYERALPLLPVKEARALVLIAQAGERGMTNTEIRHRLKGTNPNSHSPPQSNLKKRGLITAEGTGTRPNHRGNPEGIWVVTGRTEPLPLETNELAELKKENKALKKEVARLKKMLPTQEVLL